MQTKYFISCKGVFQGGGCRGVALAGAVSEAFKRGVRFSEVAGTSAGSIVAVLLGAGASPEQLEEIILELDYKQFMQPPRKSDFSRTVGTSITGFLAGFKDIRIREFLSVGGVYSSWKIESWVEEKLKQILPEVSGKVCFKHLPTPTHVVASSLVEKKPKVWNSITTPDESVAFAVRASCSIPIFFQPVEQGETYFVDGGVLSNLPLFVFNEVKADRKYCHERVLAFVLQSSAPEVKPSNSFQYLFGLANLAVEGASNLQKGIQSNVSYISIDTGEITATDFEKMNEQRSLELLKNGDRAASEFFANEHIHTAGKSYLRDEAWDEHQAYYAVVERAEGVREQVIFSDTSTNWFWQLFPTILGWKLKGVDVQCLANPVSGDASQQKREEQRRKYLKGIGVPVTCMDNLPFKGVVMDGNQTVDSYAIVKADDESDFVPFGKVYRNRENSIAVKAMYQLLMNHAPPLSKIEYIPKIEKIESERVTDMLKAGISHYRQPNVEFSFEDVPLANISLLSKYVRGFRLRQLPQLAAALEQNNIDLFAPSKVVFEDQNYSIITPPVFEHTGNSYVAIEGNTRSFLAYSNSLETIKGIVVRNVSSPLPGIPVHVSKVRIATEKLPPGERIEGFDHSLFRQIERSTHPLD